MAKQVILVLVAVRQRRQIETHRVRCEHSGKARRFSASSELALPRGVELMYTLFLKPPRETAVGWGAARYVPCERTTHRRASVRWCVEVKMVCRCCSRHSHCRQKMQGRRRNNGVKAAEVP